MESKANAVDKMECSIEAQRNLALGLLVGTKWDFECYDKFGNLKWEDRNRPNIITHEGLDFLLNVMFHGTAAVATWYCFPVETDTAAAATMTYAVPGFTESQAYDEANRIAFNEAAASGQSITNSANKAAFTVSSTKTFYGGALVGGGTDGNTKGDTAGGGTLMAYSKFSSSKAVEDGDTFKITITITVAHA
jgi:hypothetical protein